MKVYFKNSRGEEQFVADIEKFTDFFEVMNEDIHKRNPDYEVPYTRIYCSDGHTITADVGSHSEFYMIKSDNATRDMNEYFMNDYRDSQKGE